MERGLREGGAALMQEEMERKNSGGVKGREEGGGEGHEND